MENILERAIIPRNPSPTALLNKEKYTLYAPVARRGQPGIAQFDDTQFVIEDQIVKIDTNIIATVSYVATAAQTAETNAKNHADSVAQTAETNAKSHADSVAQTAETNAKSHADSVAQTAETNAKSHADVVARTAETNAKNYANIVTQNAELDAKNYADSVAQTAETNAKKYTDKLVSAGWTREIVTELPTPENAKPNAVYMIKRSAGLDTNDVYDEYFLVTVNGVPKLELMGNTELDLSQYTPIGSANDESSAHTYYGLKNEINDVRSSINNVLTDMTSIGTIAVPPEAGNTANIVSVGCRYSPAYEISPKKFSLFYVDGVYQESVTIDGVTISWNYGGHRNRILIKGQCDPPVTPGNIQISSTPLYEGVVGVATKIGLNYHSHGQGAPDLPPVYVSVGDKGVATMVQVPVVKEYTPFVTIQGIYIRLQRGVYYDNVFEILINNARGRGEYRDTLDELTSIDSFDENGRIISSRQVGVPHACSMYSMPNALDACDKFLFLDKTAFVLKECEKYVFTGDEPWQSDVEGVYYCRLTDILNFPKPFKAVDGDRKFNSTVADDIMTIDCTGAPIFKTVDDLKGQLRQMHALERPYTCIVALQDPYIAEEVDFEVGSLRVKSGGTIVPNPTGKGIPVEVTVASGSGDLAQAAYAHSQIIGNPHNTTAADVGTYSKEESDKKYAPLVDGKVPAENLPSYMDDVVEGSMATSFGDFYPSGEHNEKVDSNGNVIPRKGVLYVDVSGAHIGKVFRWSGTGFVQVASTNLPDASEGNRGQFLMSDGSSYTTEEVRQLPFISETSDSGKALIVDDATRKAAWVTPPWAEKSYVDGLVGDISTALDELHAYAQNLVNGGSAK